MTPAEVLYHKYLTVVAEANHSPLPFIQWCDLGYLVPVRYPMGFPLGRKPIDTGSASRRKPRITKQAELEADVRAEGWTVRRISPIGEKSLFLCRACTSYLPDAQFSKQGKYRRSICKACDNKRRRSTPQSA